MLEAIFIQTPNNMRRKKWKRSRRILISKMRLRIWGKTTLKIKKIDWNKKISRLKNMRKSRGRNRRKKKEKEIGSMKTPINLKSTNVIQMRLIKRLSVKIKKKDKRKSRMRLKKWWKLKTKRSRKDLSMRRRRKNLKLMDFKMSKFWTDLNKLILKTFCLTKETKWPLEKSISLKTKQENK